VQGDVAVAGDPGDADDTASFTALREWNAHD